ncbi:Uma2 family endonuclease [Aureimonas psammosilenae]|uniref:Uma2 family endonuclease n=1 Tax=Aureimonas psammosilenae TaxID=2495496 RepID=UPI001261138F|nr:Uma2 family endonuclease [Aureimonas psammosilenae]
MNVQTLSRPSKTMTVEEFFGWIETRQEKYELVEGTPRLQPWVKRNHAKIVSNISYLVMSQIDRGEYDLYQGDFAIATGPRNVRYADVMVEKVGGSGQARTTESAVLIVEVLSPSTAAEDFGRKQQEYLNLPTLDTYLIVAQDARCLWQWTRDENGNWPEEPLVIEEGSVEISALGASLALEDVYRNVS